MLPSMNWPTAKMPATISGKCQFGQNLHERHPDREHETEDRADEGNEGDEPGEQPDQEAEAEPGKAQPGA